MAGVTLAGSGVAHASEAGDAPRNWAEKTCASIGEEGNEKCIEYFEKAYELVGHGIMDWTEKKGQIPE
ncbi:hypothetical protein [Frankia sp. CiP3]|uniref:hypothetical protein n=1 Tax=Frankia sp. CiP3 TaxID=2880971 RepID=UPI001EF4EA03|nr:hypothetical protein [Frankia sp. CiP3]